MHILLVVQTGMQYSVVAKKALDKFNKQRNFWLEHRLKPVDLKRKYEEDIPIVSIYHADKGMLPHYAGHVQGNRVKVTLSYIYKFQFLVQSLTLLAGSCFSGGGRGQDT